MKNSIRYILLLFLSFSTSCDREIEQSQKDFGFDYQPLGISNFWIYQVDQTIYFGENDSETSSFFYRDQIISFYIDDEDEQVFIVDRSSSTDQANWTSTMNYGLKIKDLSLVRNFENNITVPLVFSPDLGRVWDGNIYNSKGQDDYRLVESIDFNPLIPNVDSPIFILNNQDDDEITFRDNRYEIYGKGIGLVEKYVEVLTYCSRNDCLGEGVIDSGERTLFKLISYGVG